MYPFTDVPSVRRRTLVMTAALAPLPLRRELEAVVSPSFREQASDAVDSLVGEGTLELVDLGSGVRVRLTDRGRRQLVELPGDSRPYAVGRVGGEVAA